MRIIVAAAVLIPCFLPSVSFAAPANLMNKTITVSATTTTPWTAGGRTGSGSRITVQTIYISSAGRVFARMVRYDRQVNATADFAPHENTFRFVRDKLIGVVQYVSGASQMIVSFDPSGQSCTAAVQMGRENGRPLTWKGNNGVTYTATGPSVVSNVTCSIVSGNAFAGQ